MLCPFCGKERRDHRRCPKCHRAQRQRWRGATEPDFANRFFPKEGAGSIHRQEADVANQPADRGASEPARTMVAQIAVRWVKILRASRHGQNK